MNIQYLPNRFCMLNISHYLPTNNITLVSIQSGSVELCGVEGIEIFLMETIFFDGHACCQ